MTPPPAVPPRIISVKEIEAVLRRLRGVVAARVVCDAFGGIEEIHAVSEADRPAKMVVRDIESALLSHWNLAPHRNKISVAQMQPGQASRPLSKPRLRFVEAQVAVTETETRARVVLRQNDAADLVGAASTGADGSRDVLLATAAVRAIESGYDAVGRLRLIETARVTLGGREMVVLLVALPAGKTDDLLTGSALVRSDPDRAVVAATLDAVNRRLAALEAPGGAK